MHNPIFESVFGESNFVFPRSIEMSSSVKEDPIGMVVTGDVEVIHTEPSNLEEEKLVSIDAAFIEKARSENPMLLISDGSPEAFRSIALNILKALSTQASAEDFLNSVRENDAALNERIKLYPTPRKDINLSFTSYDHRQADVEAKEATQEADAISERLIDQIKQMDFGRSKPTSLGGYHLPPGMHQRVFQQSTDSNWALWREANPSGTIWDYMEQLRNLNNDQTSIELDPADPDPDATIAMICGTIEQAQGDILKKTKPVRKYILKSLDEWFEEFTRTPYIAEEMDIDRYILMQDTFKLHRKYIKNMLKKIIEVTDPIESVRFDLAERNTWAFLGKDEDGEWWRPISLTIDEQGNFTIYETYAETE